MEFGGCHPSCHEGPELSLGLAGVEEAPPQPKTPVPKTGKKAAKATGKRKSIALEDDHTAQQSVVVAAPGSIIATVNWLGTPLCQ